MTEVKSFEVHEQPRQDTTNFCEHLNFSIGIHEVCCVWL